MTYDIGDVVKAPELEVWIYDDNGVLANAGSVTLTITKPDGTTTAPTVSNPATGRYTASYTAATVGRHKVDWVATGANASAFSTSFDVRGTVGGLFGLEEARDYLNIPSTTNDDELQSFVDVVSQAVEDITGLNFRRSAKRQVFDGGQTQIVLDNLPVLSVTQVLESGTTVAASGYSVTVDGVLTRLSSSYAATTFVEGFQNVDVTYTVGYTDVPAPVRHAALVMLKHLWTTQRGSMPLARAGAEDDFLPGSTYSVPRRVIELLSPYTIPGIA
jgi:hypothetical protein